ncbi:MAG: universal stress protein [Deltaproteobacteria bacterium]|nr:universal stress protein [Deltaproteobacteria bacterium]
METPKRILVPTDFSESAEKALDYALMLAHEFDAELYLLHIISDIDHHAIDYSLTESMVKQYRETSFNNSKEKMGNEIKKRPETKDMKVITEIRIGHPYQEILNVTEQKKIDLIVISTHGRSAFIHQIMGSVAERVLRGAKCPILLMRF